MFPLRDIAQHIRPKLAFFSLFPLPYSLLHQYCHPNETSRIPLLCDCLALEPLLLDHSLQQRAIRPGSGPQGAYLGGFAVLEIIEDGVFAILLFGRQPRPPRRPFCGPLVQHSPARWSDTVHPLTFYLGGKRQHPADHLADGCAVVLRDPTRKLHLPGVQQRRGVHHSLNGLGCNAFGERVVMHPHDDAHEHLTGKRHDDPRADARLNVIHRVGKRPVERHRQSDVAVERHSNNPNARSASTGKREKGRDGLVYSSLFPFPCTTCPSAPSPPSPFEDLSRRRPFWLGRGGDRPGGT